VLPRVRQNVNPPKGFKAYQATSKEYNGGNRFG
jgi:hypothetical protein